MKIRVAIVSSIVVSSLWLLPLIAEAAGTKLTTVQVPHAKCLSDCQTGYKNCLAKPPSETGHPVGDPAQVRYCDSELKNCRNVLCADSPTQ